MYLAWKIFVPFLYAVLVSGCLFEGGETEGRGGSETEGLHGKMIFEDGYPAEGAVVTAKVSTDSTGLHKSAPADSAVDTTDSQGRYSFTTLNPGSYSIKGAWWKNNAKDTLKAFRDSVPYDGEDTDVGVDTLLPPGRINLSIVHEPVEGVDCYITGVTATYKSDSLGLCEVVNLIPDTYTLSYGKQGYLTQTVRVEVFSGETTTLTAKRLWADPKDAPPPPQNVKAQYHRESGTALIEWDSVYVEDLLGYEIRRNVNDGGYQLLETISDTFHLDSIYPLMLDTNRKVIQYRIRSLDTDGNASINSSTVEIEATPPNKPGDPRPVNEDPSVGLTPVLQWSEVLPIGGELPYYQILLGTHRDSLAILVSDLETETFALDSLLPNKTYYWQIITTVGDSVVIGPVWTFHTRVNQSPTAPQLLSPSQNEVVNDSSVHLQWSATDPDKEDTLSYRVLFGKDSASLEALVEKTADTTFSLNDLDSGTTYYWKVIAYDLHDSSASDLGRFSIYQAPEQLELLYPGADETGIPRQLELRWRAKAGSFVNMYFIYFGEDSTDLELLDSTGDTSFTVSNLTQGTPYRWRIVMNDGTSLVSSETISFTTNYLPQIAAPVYPIPGTKVRDTIVTLSWSGNDPDDDSLIYRIFMGPDTNNFTFSTMGDTFTSTPTYPPGDTIYWRVNVISESNKDTTKGDLWWYVINASPVIDSLSPTGGDTLGTSAATLRWNVNDANGDSLTYKILWGSDSSSLTDTVLVQNEVTLTNLPRERAYYWRLMVYDDMDSTVSPLQYFYTKQNAPPEFTAFNPVPDSVLSSLFAELSWDTQDQDGDPLSFRLLGGTDSNNLDLVDLSLDTAGFQWNDLQKATTYYWRVMAYDGFDSTYSKLLAFQSKGNTAPTLPNLAFPAPDTVVTDSNLSFSWSGGDPDPEDDLRYTLLIGEDSSSLSPLAQDIQDSSAASGPLSNFKTYYWRVIAYDGYDSTFSPVSWFRVDYPALVAHWDFNEGSGNVLGDKSGNGNHGGIIGAEWASVNSLSILRLNGIDEYIDLGNCVQAGDNCWKAESFTIEAWASLSNTLPNNEQSRLLYLGQDNGTINLGVQGSDILGTTRHENMQYYDTKFPIEDTLLNKIVHMVYIHDHQTNLSKLYIDGTMVDSVATIGDLLTPTLPDWDPPYLPSIGNFKGQYSPSLFHKGVFKDLKIFNYALTGEAVTESFNAHPNFQNLAIELFGELVAHWDFDEGSGTVLEDKSGNGNLGTIRSARWAQFGNNKVLNFEGLDDFASSSSCIQTGGKCWTPNEFTIETWVTMDQILPEQWPTSQIINLVNSEGGISLNLNRERLVGSATNTNSQLSTVGYDFSSDVGEFTHIVFLGRLSNRQIYLYINGTLRDSASVSSTFFSEIDSILVGKDASSSTYFNGMLMELQVYDYGLSDSSIFAHYSNSVPSNPNTTPKLIAHWDFNEGSGGILQDKSGNENHGMLQGDPVWVQGIEGTALQLNGVDQFVSIDKYESFRLNRLTISAWVKPRDLLSNEHAIFSTLNLSGDHTNEKQGYTLKFQNGGQMTGAIARTDGIEKRGGANKLVYDIFPTSLDTNYHHVALTFDGSTVIYYLDGAQINTIDYIGKIDNRVITPTIGASPENAFADGYLYGTLDEIKIYNYALPQDSIQEFFNSMAP